MVEVVAGPDHQSDQQPADEGLGYMGFAVGTHSAEIVHLVESLRME